MKKFAYIFLAAQILCMSCDPDLETHHPMLEARESPSQRTLYTPDNSDNPYDHVGRTYRESMTKAFSDIGVDKSSAQKDNTTSRWQLSRALFSEPGPSILAHTSLRELVDMMVNVRYDGYPFFHKNMVAYEAKIMDHPRLGDMDKQIILSLASIVRHANFPEINVQVMSGVEDEDWDISIPNAKGAVQLILENAERHDADFHVPISATGPSSQEP